MAQQAGHIRRKIVGNPQKTAQGLIPGYSFKRTRPGGDENKITDIFAVSPSRDGGQNLVQARPGSLIAADSMEICVRRQNSVASVLGDWNFALRSKPARFAEKLRAARRKRDKA